MSIILFQLLIHTYVQPALVSHSVCRTGPACVAWAQLAYLVHIVHIDEHAMCNWCVTCLQDYHYWNKFCKVIATLNMLYIFMKCHDTCMVCTMLMDATATCTCICAFTICNPYNPKLSNMKTSEDIYTFIANWYTSE